MSISTLNPWQVLDQLQQDAFRRQPGKPNTTSAQQWHPATDIQETQHCYQILMDLPGSKIDDINIEVENNQLSIAGKRTQARAETVKTHHKERVVGTFSRKFQLPKDADFAQISAHFEAGVLSVTINKQEEIKPRKVNIQSND